MKTWIIRLCVFTLILAMLGCVVGCSDEQDGGGDTQTPDDTQTPGDTTPDEGKTPETPSTPTADELTVEDFDPEATYEMPDLSALNIADYITLGRYRGLTLTLDYDDITITDEVLDAEIDALLREHHPDFKVTDRAVEWGDTVVADYVGTLDGVAFSGGSAQAQTLSLKDNSGYIPGFVEGLVGAEVGKEHAVDVTFPEEYHNADLAGKAVVFTFKVHYIEGSPELDDAFVTDYTDGEYTSGEAYREARRQQMADAAYDTALHTALWSTITENAAVKKYPADAVMSLYASYYNYYSFYASMYQTDFKTFLALYVGGTPEDLFAFCKDMVKKELVYYAVFEAGNYSYTDEQYARALDLYTEANYESLAAEMAAAGREDFPIEEARDYFDRDEGHKKQIIYQCLEESAYNDLVASAKIVVDGAPEEGGAS